MFTDRRFILEIRRVVSTNLLTQNLIALGIKTKCSKEMIHLKGNRSCIMAKVHVARQDQQVKTRF